MRSVASSVAAFIFSQLSLAWVTLFSANSRKAAGTSIFGISNFGRSKRGISNFGTSAVKPAAAALGFALVVVTSDMMVVLLLSLPARAVFRDPPPRPRRFRRDFMGRAKPAGRKRPCFKPYNTGYAALQYK